MNRIDKAFTRLRQEKEKALVGFVTAGDPSAEQSMEIITAMCEAGLDILELGVPFSDPTADGPVIQRSSGRALKAGMNLRKVLDMTREIRKSFAVPIVIFSYYNPILAYGGAAFYKDATAAGADGVLIVDLPPEEAEELTSLWDGTDLALIRLVAPTTPPDRMEMIGKGSSGFLYLVSMTGVTGSGGLDIQEISQVSKTLEARANGTPICVGFGISTPEQVKAVSALADGVVVGSAFERLIETNLEDPALAERIGDAVRSLKAATR